MSFVSVRSPWAQLQTTLHLEVRHEREAREEGIRQLNGLLNFAAYLVSSIMAVGATLGAANSLYTIIDSRRREIATLRALGFIWTNGVYLKMRELLAGAGRSGPCRPVAAPAGAAAR